MHWLQTLDTGLFHLVNPALSNSFLDIVMPFFSGNVFFIPAVVIAGILLIWKDGARGRMFLLMFILAIALGDPLVCNTLKHLIGRPRPFLTLPDVHMPASIGRGGSGSMPSSHAANWFAATMVAFIYYRRSIRFMLPMALLVSFSRIYNGVHYPADVLAGAILGAGYGAGGVWTLDALWKWAGARWFPLWWQHLPSLMNPIVLPPRAPVPDEAELREKQWLRLGYTFIVVQLAVNLAYIASGVLTLTGDEAYQWIWSKHLALSYYSKPPIIAYLQFLGTHLWGDTVFGVRFFSPVLTALTVLALFRFMAKVTNVRLAFWLAVMLPATPLLSVGSVLMTIDPPSVMFWVLAMIAGWRAVRENATTGDWFWVGLWMGFGFLSKYTSLFQLLSWALFFALYAPARRQLARPGPYVALLVNLICALPVLIWNHQHGWVTITHVSDNARLDEPWAFTVGNLVRGFLKYTTEFLAAETALQNPFFFLPTLWAAVAFWRRQRGNPLQLYFFSMGAPIFLCYFLWTFHSRVYPNWIAPAVLPLFCLAAVYWNERLLAGCRPIKICLIVGIVFGYFAVVILHDTNLISKLSAGLVQVPADKDSTRRAKGWAEATQAVEAARQKLLAEGKPVFIIGGHYTITGEITFNLPEAKAGSPDHPLVYFQTSPVPKNQFFFWPGYHNRKGQNAIYVPEELQLSDTNTLPAPDFLKQEFESVTDLGAVMVTARGQPLHRLQIFECRGLR